MSRFEYPRLSRSEIVHFLSETQIIPNITEHHLADPSPGFISDVYIQLLVYLDSFTEEDGQIQFAALEQLENPDFHVESVRNVNLFVKLRDVIASLDCPKKFTFKDLVKPDAERTEVFVSAILNYCFHKNNKMDLLRPMVEELNLLDEQRSEWENKIAQLNGEIAVHNEAREKEMPLVQEVDAKVKELQQTISELNNNQMSLRAVYRKLKEKVGDMDEKISGAEFALVRSVQENAELRSKIVQSPDKLQRALEEKKLVKEDALDAERLAKKDLEDKSSTVEIYAKAMKKMSKHLTQMQKIQEQINAAKTIEKDVKALKANLSDEGVSIKSLDAKLVELEGKVDQLDKLRLQTRKESQVQCEEAVRELNNIRQEVISRKHELEARQRKVESVVEKVDSINMKIRMVGENSAAKRLEISHKCEFIIQEFHQYLHSLEAVMPTVDAS
ncbi:hypothetical protein MLD38_026663 [Melastoma candidum]|uniref:Uncharacterized protein n=1 Tax=Melastoma candidum TaxID=119954 RepID=A0ACB9NZ55_9MYRT|nr:hypothetical protein MLD38_026663 [Melastoma candidum]